MNNKVNDELADQAIDNIAKVMETNGTIPEEARHMLEKEEYIRLLEQFIDHESEQEVE